MNLPLKLLLVAGARPNFMKIAPLIHAIEVHNTRCLNGEQKIEYRLVHTGQHYDSQMSHVFFEELQIPQPDICLDVGSGSHAIQTARVMERFEPVLLNAFRSPSHDSASPAPSPLLLGRGEGQGEESPQSSVSFLQSSSAPPGAPDWVVVVGDVNSTMACALVASKLGIRVAHIEAGLRSFDRTMPEEINRLVTDSLADLLLTPSEDANENLRREGVPEHKIKLVGNIMIDSLVAHLNGADRTDILDRLRIQDRRFIYVTLHRPSNVDCGRTLGIIVEELSAIADQWPVIFPMHPRTRKRLQEFGLTFREKLGLKILDPIGYNDSLALTKHARCVLTDSGGLQEESTYFLTPCLTLRPNTERPVTVQLGSNRLTTVERLRSDFSNVLQNADRLGTIPPLWDGHAAERILQALAFSTTER